MAEGIYLSVGCPATCSGHDDSIIPVRSCRLKCTNCCMLAPACPTPARSIIHNFMHCRCSSTMLVSPYRPIRSQRTALRWATHAAPALLPSWWLGIGLHAVQSLGAHCASRHAESASARKGWAHPAALLMLGLRNAQTRCCVLLQITLAANYFGPVFLTVISLHPCLDHTL